MIQKRYKSKNNKLVLNFIFAISIIISTSFLGIGYANLTSTELNINLQLSATAFAGIFISNVEYVSNNGADITNSQIIDYTETMLHSNIYLSTTDRTSTITYSVTIINNSDAIKKFTGVTYLDSAYSNNDITYTIDGLNVDDTIAKGESKTFNITFKYNNISTITNNQLDSYLSFNFDYYLEGENEVDIKIESGESYEFAGVTPETPVDLNNIANVSFVVMNGSSDVITGVDVSLTYTTTTGNSKQTANISLYDENNNVLQTKSVQFQGKQNNTVVTINFTNLNIPMGTKLTVKFAQGTVANGAVDVSNVTLTPVF